jgi:hypothetical protein
VKVVVATTAVVLAAAAAVTMLLLNYGADRHDPVGRLSPVAQLPSRSPGQTSRLLPPPTTTGEHEGGQGSDD